MSSTMRWYESAISPKSVVHLWHLCWSAVLLQVTGMHRGASRFPPFLPAPGVLYGSRLPLVILLFSAASLELRAFVIFISSPCFCSSPVSLLTVFSASFSTVSRLACAFSFSFVACVSRFWALFFLFSALFLAFLARASWSSYSSIMRLLSAAAILHIRSRYSSLFSYSYSCLDATASCRAVSTCLASSERVHNLWSRSISPSHQCICCLASWICTILSMYMSMLRLSQWPFGPRLHNVLSGSTMMICSESGSYLI